MLKKGNEEIAVLEAKKEFDVNLDENKEFRVYAMPINSPDLLCQYIEQTQREAQQVQVHFEEIAKKNLQLKTECADLESRKIPAMRKNEQLIYAKMSRIILRIARRKENIGGLREGEALEEASREIEKATSKLEEIYFNKPSETDRHEMQP